MLESAITMPRSKRDSGEGTYETLKSGLVRHVVMKDGRRIKGPACKNKEQARNALKKKLQNQKRNAAVPSLSLSTWMRNWLNDRTLSPTTTEVYSWWIDAFERDPLGSMSLRDITDSEVEAWRDRQKLSAVTIKKRLGFLKTILRAAKITVDVKPPAVQKSLRRPLTPKERAELMGKLATAPPKTKLAILLTFQMGLSRSEACGLKFEDYTDGWVWIVRSVVETEDAVHEKSTKTTNRVRHIMVPPLLRPYFEEGKKGFVLGDVDMPLSPHKFSNMLRYLIEGTSLEKVPYMGLHALRRTFGMMLLESGTDLITAAELMGHDPIMLAKVYAGSRDDLKKIAMEKAFGT